MITSPTLLIDEEKCHNNIIKMAGKANEHNLGFKPHFKTHQSAQIGEWFSKAGTEAITVSSVAMGAYFAEHGWGDITIAFPVNILQIDAINDLSSMISKLSLFVVDPQTLQFLDQHLHGSVEIYIEIDTGGARSGLRADESDSIEQLIELIQSSGKMNFTGFYTHPGHSYAARSADEVLTIYKNVQATMQNLKEQYPFAKCCVGDTPCCSLANNFKGIDEISPGNFVFYDLMQYQIGACEISDIAVVLAAPVVARKPERNKFVVHAGAVHLSKESISFNGQTIFGLPVLIENSGWSKPIEKSFIKSISQEHGILHASDQLMQALNIGDIVGILPVHSCLTANLMRNYYSLQINRLIN